MMDFWMNIKSKTKIFLICGVVIGHFSCLARAQENSNGNLEKFDILSEAIDQTGLITGSILSESQMLSYCVNISDLATEARNSILEKNLKKIEKDADSKLNVLQLKIVELQKWILKREAFLENVNESLIKIYESMRPDAAALQLTEIGPVIASGIILKLNPKISSAILTEMKPADAATISIILTSSKDVDDAEPKL